MGWVFSPGSWGQLGAQGGAGSQNWDLWIRLWGNQGRYLPWIIGSGCQHKQVDSGCEGGVGRSRGPGLSYRVGWWSPSLGGLQLEMKSVELLLPLAHPVDKNLVPSERRSLGDCTNKCPQMLSKDCWKLSWPWPAHLSAFSGPHCTWQCFLEAKQMKTPRGHRVASSMGTWPGEWTYIHGRACKGLIQKHSGKSQRPLVYWAAMPNTIITSFRWLLQFQLKLNFQFPATTLSMQHLQLLCTLFLATFQVLISHMWLRSYHKEHIYRTFLLSQKVLRCMRTMTVPLCWPRGTCKTLDQQV